MNRRNSESASPENMQMAQISINGERLTLQVFIFCVLAELLLVFCDATVNYARYSHYETIQRLFNITREDGLASWFMVTQTFVTAQILWVTLLLQRSQGESRSQMAGWGFLAVFFTYMAADDGAKIHERFGTMFSQAYGGGDSANTDSLMGQLQSIFPSYEWQIVALPFFAVAGLFMVFFLWKEFHTNNGRLLLVASALCMACAVGLDFIEGLDAHHAFNLHAWISKTFSLRLSMIRHFSKSLEEFLEMLAMSLLLMLFLRHLIWMSGPGLGFSFQKTTRQVDFRTG